jgi:hypothetical protein
MQKTASQIADEVIIKTALSFKPLDPSLSLDERARITHKRRILAKNYWDLVRKYRENGSGVNGPSNEDFKDVIWGGKRNIASEAPK